MRRVWVSGSACGACHQTFQLSTGRQDALQRSAFELDRPDLSAGRDGSDMPLQRLRTTTVEIARTRGTADGLGGTHHTTEVCAHTHHDRLLSANVRARSPPDDLERRRPRLPTTAARADVQYPRCRLREPCDLLSPRPARPRSCEMFTMTLCMNRDIRLRSNIVVVTSSQSP